MDWNDDSLGKKIKRATDLKIPVILIVGPKDAAAKTVSIRRRDEEKTLPLKELPAYLREIAEK